MDIRHPNKPTTSLQERPQRLARVLRRIEGDMCHVALFSKNIVTLMKIVAILVKATINFLRNIRD
ncbi:hypothetical protein A3H22_04100 [Candidatus Peribacteria bacterium RIFCSPLOWO2_12_FULL_55_15]|nr:MAG: hypothetical protein A3D12_03555 [Candidatus Peribacteria bacterium RIFCSPHIGHO2_02_FULL_55_24]OGJ64193.1 MAG: hypothetical protein A3E47_03955 [Candidatus Peribacteria bacterium RIFCSPHIGHO2_12_FULL_54_10]OGJ71472.1 MAG: hypothetical protein A3H22_04100 [Candidatus Peribacteria bacterium RIFCSPLOWO2_12_FULL_55_15]